MRYPLAVTLALIATAGHAQTGIGLTGERTLVAIDLATAAVTPLTEVQIPGRVLGIDWRPATEEVIAVTDRFEVVTIDLQTGMIRPVVVMDTPLPITEGAPVIVDINPAADALRFMNGTVNHRVNLTTGAVFVDGALHFSAGTDGVPMVGGTAYSNSHGRPDSTAMFNVDTAISALLRQAPPNDGTNTPVGMLGAMIEGPVGFDIGTDAAGANTAWLTANGALHRVDLDSGAVTGSWTLGGTDAPLRDLTIVPGM